MLGMMDIPCTECSQPILDGCHCEGYTPRARMRRICAQDARDFAMGNAGYFLTHLSGRGYGVLPDTDELRDVVKAYAIAYPDDFAEQAACALADYMEF